MCIGCGFVALDIVEEKGGICGSWRFMWKRDGNSQLAGLGFTACRTVGQ